MPIKYSYWNIRGLGSAPRLLLRHVAAEYEDTIYDMSGGHRPGSEEANKWYNVKNSLGLDFPNLPYLIDGEVKVTQSFAILKYLGRKFGLAATADPEIVREEMLLFQIQDLHMQMVMVAYVPHNTDEGYQKAYDYSVKSQAEHLGKLENFLQEGKQWLLGDRLSYVDFWAYEVIDRCRTWFDQKSLDNYPKLNAYLKQFEALPKLADYLASDEYRKAPIFAPQAQIGGVRKN